MRILVLEDDRAIASHIEAALVNCNYIVDLAYDGKEGLFLGRSESYDGVILDLGLPGEDGFKILQIWRHHGRSMPVMVLSGRSTWQEKVIGLRAGADDYMSKPFEIEEMLARLQSLIRRSSGHASSIIRCGSLEFDQASNQVRVGGKPVKLTGLEHSVLTYLMYHQGNIISKTRLTEHAYGQDFDRDSNVIEVLIFHLRKKVGKNIIITHRGMGVSTNRKSFLILYKPDFL